MARFTILLIAVSFGCPRLNVHAEDWPEFRGPTGQGLYSGKPLPTEWTTTKNVVWKVPVPGHGWSSPIIWKGCIYLTSAVPVKDSKDLLLETLCLDAGTGKLLWQTEVFREDGIRAPKIHGKNSHASPTPLTDGRRLYVHFGHQGTAALDFQGQILWRNTEHPYAPVHGNGGTPILVQDRLVYSADGGDKQFVVALNVATGKTVWKTDRKCQAPKKFSFSTPLLITLNGRPQIISPASNMVGAYDPADGKEIWRVTYEGYSVIPRPVFGHGLVFLSTSFDQPKLLAIRPEGTGNVAKANVVWTLTKGAPHTPSPLLVGDELYVVSDQGLASCLDARTGKIHWQSRVGERFSASPFFAGGKIYFQSETGATAVIKAGKEFIQLAASDLGERTLASYAAADGALFLRTESQLYRLQGTP